MGIPKARGDPYGLRLTLSISSKNTPARPEQKHSETALAKPMIVLSWNGAGATTCVTASLRENVGHH